MMKKLDRIYSREDFLRLFQEHKSCKIVAAKIGWSTSVVSRYKSELGITRKDYENFSKGKPSWNSGTGRILICEECGSEKKVCKNNRRFCSRECSATHVSRMFKDGRFLGEKNPNYGNDKVKEAWSRGAYGHVKRTGKDNPNYGNGQALADAHRRGLFKNARSGDLGYTRGKRTLYKGVSFKSTWEAEFAKELDEKGLTWIYEPEKFQVSSGKFYLPDFYVVEENKYYEIKGFWWPKAKMKFDLFLNEYPEINIEVKSEEWWNQRQIELQNLNSMKED